MVIAHLEKRSSAGYKQVSLAVPKPVLFAFVLVFASRLVLLYTGKADTCKQSSQHAALLLECLPDGRTLSLRQPQNILNWTGYECFHHMTLDLFKWPTVKSVLHLFCWFYELYRVYIRIPQGSSHNFWNLFTETERATQWALSKFRLH